jgi:hypothetical protein
VRIDVEIAIAVRRLQMQAGRLTPLSASIMRDEDERR